jgi:hypothetical protein
MFKYEPSAGALDETFNALVLLRHSLAKRVLELYEEGRNINGFCGGICDEDEVERQRQDWSSRFDQVNAQKDIVNNLLIPFDREWRQGIEDYERRACDRMMHL